MRSPESYFERDTDGIRLKGHRMWLEDILALYKNGMTAQQIAADYTTLSLDEAKAAIAYYHAHTDEVDRYMEQQYREAEEREREAEINPSATQRRLHTIMGERRHSASQA